MSSQKAFRSILFPVDFSPTSEATASHVRGLAHATGATVTLLHVTPWLSAWYDVTEVRPTVAGNEDLRQLEKKESEALERFQEKHFKGVPCRREVVPGGVAETIVEFAQTLEADLIMMPTRGLGRSRPFLIGSTTAKVLHDARCAVWTSPHTSNLGEFKPYDHILVTVDREDVPQGYLEEAARLAASLGSKLSFISAIPSLTGGYGEEHKIDSLAREFPQAHVQQVVIPPDCRVLSKTGEVGNVVRRAVETHSVDLVITNRGHLQHPFGRFRSHTYEIVLESPCPVLSLFISCALGSRTEELDSTPVYNSKLAAQS